MASLASSCSGSAPAASRKGGVRVAEIETGRRIGPDKRVIEAAQDFAPGATVYVSVVTEGTAPEALLVARWTRGTEVLEETEQRITPQGRTVSEFHVRNPSGWPAGSYRVEIVLDGASAGAREFTVRQGVP